ncbi:MAG: 3-deoxy-D-manno-octulosonic acid transferase [Desulfuromonadaceae bacterium]|nr:3-deoxy-D-manno-octulosonic acid transferase [Desulfuromonadaceae bacterium]
MVYLLYDILLLLSMVVLLPWYVIRGCVRGKGRQGLRERLGFLSPSVLALLKGRQVIWLHAVSVGETRAAVPLIKKLRLAYPDAVLLLSNVTETGREIAEAIPEIDVCIYFPIDFSAAVKRVVKKVNPALVLIVETEIWPQFVRMCHKYAIPVVLVNGRISDRSFPRYSLVGSLLKPVLAHITFFCMQSELDAHRIAFLGASPEKISVSGNIKFDQSGVSTEELDQTRLRAQFGIAPEARVWVAGSTHQGEDEIVMRVYQQLLQSFPDLILILVPRHPHRCRQVSELLSKAGVTWYLRSDNVFPPLTGGSVLLVDTLGEMLNFYTVADIVFVGGSLVPVGGHNILEASMVEKPVMFGPWMQNFKDIAKFISAAQGFGEVRDAEGLQQLLTKLLHDKDLRRSAGVRGATILQQHAGATRKTLGVVRQVLGF